MINGFLAIKKYGDGREREFVKRGIRAGKIVSGDRSCGKTQGLHEVIHEDFGGKATVVCVSNREARLYRSWYRDAFPGELAPKFVSATCERIADLCGNIFVDGYSRMDYEVRELLAGMFSVVRGVA